MALDTRFIQLFHTNRVDLWMRPSAHPSGALVRGYLKGNEYFIPELFSPLYEEVAERYANFSNLLGFNDGSFDGAGWFTRYGRWGFSKFASLVYQNLDHPTSLHTSGLVPSSPWPEYRFNSVKIVLYVSALALFSLSYRSKCVKRSVL